MKGRELLIGVTGGIAAYKTAALVSQLVQAGAGVTVIMTRSATKLVGPKTFEALTGRPVQLRVFGSASHPHIEVAQRAELSASIEFPFKPRIGPSARKGVS